MLSLRTFQNLLLAVVPTLFVSNVWAAPCSIPEGGWPEIPSLQELFTIQREQAKCDAFMAKINDFIAHFNLPLEVSGRIALVREPQVDTSPDYGTADVDFNLEGLKVDFVVQMESQEICGFRFIEPQEATAAANAGEGTIVAKMICSRQQAKNVIINSSNLYEAVDYPGSPNNFMNFLAP